MLNEPKRPSPGAAPVPFFVEVASGASTGVYVGGWSFPDGHITLMVNRREGFETDEEEFHRWLPFLAEVISSPRDQTNRLRGASDSRRMQGRAIAGLIARHPDEFARLLADERAAIKNGHGDSTHWGAR